MEVIHSHIILVDIAAPGTGDIPESNLEIGIIVGGQVYGRLRNPDIAVVSGIDGSTGNIQVPAAAVTGITFTAKSGPGIAIPVTST